MDKVWQVILSDQRFIMAIAHIPRSTYNINTHICVYCPFLILLLLGAHARSARARCGPAKSRRDIRWKKEREEGDSATRHRPLLLEKTYIYILLSTLSRFETTLLDSIYSVIPTFEFIYEILVIRLLFIISYK